MAQRLECFVCFHEETSYFKAGTAYASELLLARRSSVPSRNHVLSLASGSEIFPVKQLDSRKPRTYEDVKFWKDMLFFNIFPLLQFNICKLPRGFQSQCIYKYVRVYIWVWVYVLIHTHNNMYIYIMYIHTHIYAFVCVYMCLGVCVFMHVLILLEIFWPPPSNSITQKAKTMIPINHPIKSSSHSLSIFRLVHFKMAMKFAHLDWLESSV